MSPPTSTQANGVIPDPRADPWYAWRVARDRAVTAYRYWSRAPVEDRRLAYAAYFAAEEQEATAAEDLRLATAETARAERSWARHVADYNRLLCAIVQAHRLGRREGWCRDLRRGG